jgi:hypothetical protein
MDGKGCQGWRLNKMESFSSDILTVIYNLMRWCATSNIRH